MHVARPHPSQALLTSGNRRPARYTPLTTKTLRLSMQGPSGLNGKPTPKGGWTRYFKLARHWSIDKSWQDTLWLLFHSGLPVRMRNPNTNGCCPCGRRETHKHLFFTCERTKKVLAKCNSILTKWAGPRAQLTWSHLANGGLHPSLPLEYQLAWLQLISLTV
jgi:hypothetical protein